jgi:AraC-like DNA-binding protein
MRKKNIEAVTIESVAKKYELPHIGNDLVLMDTLRSLPNVMEARRMSLCLFIGVCTNGIVTLAVNDKKRAASSNNVMIITEESVVTDLQYSDDFDGIGIFVSYKLLQDILRDVRNASDLFLLTHNYPVFELETQETQRALEYFKSIKERVGMEKHRYRLEVVRLLILTMIYDFVEAFDRQIFVPGKDAKQTRAEQLFVQFVTMVKNNFREQRQVQWYASQMGITPKYLCEVISNTSRRSPNDWIDKFVTAEMRNLLRHTDMKMSEIAAAMNFHTQSFFGKYFKENVGISPTEYRNGVEPKK